MTNNILHRCVSMFRKVYASARVRTWGHTIVSVLSVGFMLWLLAYSARELQQEVDHWRTYAVALGLGVLLYPLSFIPQALIWQGIVNRLGSTRPNWKDLEIYARTCFFKHLPGVAWFLAGRVVLYRDEGVSAQITLTASLLEWLFLVTSSVITFLSIFLCQETHWGWVLLWLAVLCVSGAMIFPYVLKNLRRFHLPIFLRRKLSQMDALNLPRPIDVALWMALFLWAYIIGGSIVYILAHYVAPSPLTFLNAWQIWSLAGGVGLVVSIFIPSGTISREFTLVGLLAPYISWNGALIVSILLRFVFILGDLVWGGSLWGVMSFLTRFQHKQKVSALIEKPRTGPPQDARVAHDKQHASIN